MRAGRTFRALVGVAGLGLLVGLTGPAGASGTRPAAPAVGLGGGGPETEEARATAAAQLSGERVEVESARSETGQLFANPDGTFTSEQTVIPVRVRRGDGWVPVDPTLAVRPDGTVGPAAVPVSLAFSGGGDAEPLVRLGQDGTELALTWPDPLPEPELAGDTAIYRDVMPDVDLRLQATPQGFSEVLVVKTRAAASHPDLATVRFGLATEGLSVRADEAGNLAAHDDTGELVFGSGAPFMWDSSSLAGPDRPGPHSRRAVGTVQVGPDHLSVRPDQELLTDPDTRYPVYIDPSFGATRTGWTLVLQGVSEPKWMGANDDRIGKSGYSNWSSPTVRYRSYFQFNTSQALGTAVKSAELNAFEIWAPSCNERPVRAYATNPVNPSTNWANQPFPGGAIDLGARNVAWGRAGCAARWVGWNATAAVRAAVSRGASTTTIMLKADNESDPYGWKKWAVNADGPALIVTYNSYPDRPTGLSAERQGCARAPNEPYVNPLNPQDQPLGPTLRARVTDRDGGLVRAQFEWYRRGGAKVGGATTANAVTGTTFQATVPSGAFGDGAQISYRVRGFDGADVGPWSGWCDVTLDRTRPDRPPQVSSATYPECIPEDGQCPAGGGVGRTGGFTLTAGGVPDVAGYLYDLHGSPSQFVAADRPGGTATALATPPDDGLQTLSVQSVDRAGNRSDIYHYQFSVGRGTPPVAHWRLEGLIETDVVDSQPGRHDGAITVGPARWVTGRHGDALRLDGTSGHVSTGNGPAVRTDRSLTVAAWVKLDRAGDAWQVAVSQDGNRTSGFYLQYASDVGRWSFNLMRADVDGASPGRVTSDAAAQVGVWTHLVGTYDRATGQVRLYVNGVRQSGVGSHTTPWNATGTVQIGRVKHNGAHTGYFGGAIDEVRIYDRVLSAAEVPALVNTPAVEELFLPLDEGSGTAAGDVSGNYRTAQLSDGASWVAGQVGAGAVRLDGAGGTLAAGGPVVRTDQSFMASALVRLDDPDGGVQAAVSQDGPRTSGFALGYRPDTHGWRFVVSTADADNPVMLTVDSAEAGIVALPGQWVHLAGVYDAVAGEVRLFVDGAPAGLATGRTTANVEGALVVGRARAAGQPVAPWNGAVDDVHVWTGVDEDRLLADFLRPVTRRGSAYGGQLSRFVHHGGWHITTSTGNVPAGFHFERSLGAFAPAGAEGTRLLYMCRLNGVDEFTSADPGCEGQEWLGPLGGLYVAPPADLPTLPVYRCRYGGGHFDSNDPQCEGRTTEFLLGYSRAYAYLIRYNSPSFPYDHVSHRALVPADYRAEGRLGLLALTGDPGTVPLRGCRAGTDSFVSTDPGCEGETVVAHLGWIWTEPPDLPSHQLFRCRASWGDLFESTDPGCEGQSVEGPLGYLVTHF